MINLLKSAMIEYGPSLVFSYFAETIESYIYAMKDFDEYFEMNNDEYVHYLINTKKYLNDIANKLKNPPSKKDALIV